MRFKSHYNREKFKPDYEINLQPSKTIPDQSMSIKEMISRYTRGLPVYGTFVPEYDGGVDPLEGVDIKSLDLSEVHEIARAVRQRYNDAMEKYTKEHDEKVQERRYQERKQKELEAARPELPKPEQPGKPDIKIE